MLEVVAKAKVAQHFKEGVVASGITDVLQVIMFTTGAYAALCRGGTAIAALIDAKENIFKLVHPGVGKQQCRIVVRHQGAAVHHLVALTVIKIEKRLTDLSGTLAHKCPGVWLEEQSVNKTARIPLPTPAHEHKVTLR